MKKRYPYHAIIASLMVESKREAWHDIVQARGRCRRRRAGAEFRLPTWHERARHGLGRGPGARVHRDDHRVGEGEGAHAGAGQTDAEYHRHSRVAARGETRRRRRALAQSTPSTPSPASISTRFMPRPNVDGNSSHGGYCGPAVKPIALNMVQQIMADPEVGAAHLRHWRHRDLARCGGVHAAGLRNRAGLHGRHALRLSHRRRHDRRARELDATTKGFATIDDFRGLSVSKVTEWKHLESELQDRRAHQRVDVHRLRPLPHRMLGRRAPVHPSGSRIGSGERACRIARWSAYVEWRTRTSIATTPVPVKSAPLRIAARTLSHAAGSDSASG